MTATQPTGTQPTATQPTDEPVRTAQCACGGLRAICSGPPARVSVCHCFACQRRTGSAYGAQARYDQRQVRVTGEFKRWTRRGDSGGSVTFTFCPTCGTNLCWTPDGLPDAVTVALGCFADPSFPQPTMTVYEDREHSWAHVPGDAIDRWR